MFCIKLSQRQTEIDYVLYFQKYTMYIPETTLDMFTVTYSGCLSSAFIDRYELQNTVRVLYCA